MTCIRRIKLMFLLLAALSIAFLNSCVTTKVFQETTRVQTEKIQALQNIAEENERKIKNLETETKSEIARLDGSVDDAAATGTKALKQAETAEALAKKLSKGKVIYEVILTNEAGKFGFGKFEISDELKSILNDIAKMIKDQNRLRFIEIEGHTDDRGSEAYNLKLGLKRAEAVRRYFYEVNLLPLHIMSVISYGESRPMADNSTKEGRAQNRRVVILILE